jgi:dienelactone hydrolase
MESSTAADPPAGTTGPFTQVFPFHAGGIGHPVLWAGSGPAVILLHELPGFGPEFWRLAHRIVQAGFTVFAPSLHRPAEASAARAASAPGLAGGLVRACISREIHLFATGSTGPLTGWLRCLARHLVERCGHPRVGVVGLCMTGNFAWSVAVEPVVAASVAAEPSLPLHCAHGLALTPAEIAALCARQDLPLMVLRFAGDPACRASRIEALRAAVGDSRVYERVLPDEAKNPAGNPFPHAVLTRDLIDREGEPTHAALGAVLAHLRERLCLPPPGADI